MSTKIYNAYKVKDGFDFLYLLNQFKKYREEYLDLVFGFLKEKNYIKDSEWFDLMEEIKKALENNYALDPLNFIGSIMVYPHKSGIYFQIFGMDSFPGWRKKLEKRIKRYSRDFHYQNSSDKPSYISEEEWKIRRKVWESIFKDRKDIKCFFESGFTFVIFDEYSINNLYIRACKDAEKNRKMS